MDFNIYKNHKLLYSTIFLGFLTLSILIAVMPAIRTQKKSRPLPQDKPLTPLQRRGLKVYISEGCQYCHTQQVRPLKMDKVYGRPSSPTDYSIIHRSGIVRMTPAVLGSSRNGPDLSDIGTRQPSSVWQYIHLYDPRAVVKESIMPAFPWLFKVVKKPDSNATAIPIPKNFAPKNGKVVPTERAKALVAYLLSLKQPSLTSSKSAATSNNPQKQKSANNKVAANGALLYSKTCAACHQSNGKGVPGAFPPLTDNPVVMKKDPTEHIRVVLYGIQGKTINGTSYSAAMPAFSKQLSDAQVAAIINHERTSWGNDAPTITAKDVDKVRSNPDLGKIQPGK
jgi:cytochrome c oxidase cbb3-type subunit 2